MLLRMSADQSRADGSGEPRRKRAPVDWEAVERDYRTGRYTLRELSAKHGAPFTTIGQRAKANEWKADLREAVKQATSAKLIEQVVREADKSVLSTTDTVLAAAEANTQIVLKHRRWLRELAADAELVRSKVTELAQGVSDMKEAAVAVSAIEAATRTLRMVVEKEREAFALDSEVEQPKPAAPQDWQTLGLPDCQAALLSMLQGARK